MILQKKTWVILDQKIISYITYSELVNIAKNVGLSVGKFYQITDKSNALAIAITTTKVQYDDALGNILIDDLGTNIQYHVTSSNLSIDDISGVFDENNKKLVFQFNEVVPDFTADDYIMGKIRRNNIWSLAKYRLSSFLSKVTGNSISWNGGFYFNFGTTLRNYLDKKGGVVAKDSYDSDMNQINTSIQNVGKENQQIIQNANAAINEAASDTAVYNKTLTSDLETGGEAIDAAKGDKLITILSKFQRYINKFKYATGIKISDNFVASELNAPINNNDTVDSSFRKIQKWMNDLGTGSIPQIEKAIMYDYIVDSDEKLRSLVMNDKATTVLIKSGTYTYDFGQSVNNVLVMHENTTLIHCEEETYIKITGDLSNREDGTTQSLFTRVNSDKKIREYCDIRIIVDILAKSGGVNVHTVVFADLQNLKRCGVVENRKNTFFISSFYNCSSLFQCYSNDMSSESFYNCFNLLGCYIHKTSNDNEHNYCCFYNCEALYYCYCDGDNYKNSRNFSACKYLHNCYVEIKTNGNTSGFLSCENLINCKTDIKTSFPTTDSIYGFESCKRVISCYSKGYSNYSRDIGFSGCLAVLLCICEGFNNNENNKSFLNSYANNGIGGHESNICQDTADGGFNNSL